MTALANGHGSGSVAPEDLSAASSHAGSLVNLSPVPSQSIDAKPFIPGIAEIRCAIRKPRSQVVPSFLGSASLLPMMRASFYRHTCNTAGRNVHAGLSASSESIDSGEVGRSAMMQHVLSRYGHLRSTHEDQTQWESL